MNYDESYKLFNQAKTLVATGDLATAIDLFKQSNDLYPHFKTLELWGECEIKRARYQQSIAPLLKAIELNNGIKPKALLATAYKELGQHTKALALAQEVLLTAPNNKMAKYIIKSNDTKTEEL